MSKKLFSFLLSELSTIRLICRGTVTRGPKCDVVPCGGVLEIPFERLGEIFVGGCVCPFCKNSFVVHDPGGNTYNPFLPFSDALAAIRAIRERVDVEFTVPDAEPD